MKQSQYIFSSGNCTIYTDADFTAIKNIATGKCVVITDENVFAAHQHKLEKFSCIVIPPGEQHKIQATADSIVQQLIALHADRQTIIIGIGGGVVTDIAGYVASVYMRGLRFGFVPTSILAMVDAAIGGKNGVDVGVYKNMVGIIRQPEFILYDISFLETLPHAEWINGFAEVIKHACIKDDALFELLESHVIDDFKKDKRLLSTLIEINVAVKTDIAVNDEFEKGERKLLNFGHTVGHAIENVHQLPHGHAVSIGMVAAAKISEEINGFYSDQKERIIALIKQYDLPVSIAFNKEEIMKMIRSDKKMNSGSINFVLLNSIGSAVVKQIGLTHLTDIFDQSF